MPISHPVYIPSKGRATTCTTPALLEASGIEFILAVEPQDADAYRQEFGTKAVLVMDKNDQGIAYARNFIKQHSIDLEHSYHWQLDDDVKQFMHRVNGKKLRVSALEALKPIEAMIAPYKNVGAAGLKHERFAWAAKRPIDYNQQICSAGLFSNEVKAAWRGYGLGAQHSDTDYSLQMLFDGFCTVTFNRILYDPPALGSIDGGCNAEGYLKNYVENLRALQRAWPGMFRIVEKKGNPRLVPNPGIWSSFSQRPLE
jgi:hypothetical protein